LLAPLEASEKAARNEPRRHAAGDHRRAERQRSLERRIDPGAESTWHGSYNLAAERKRKV